MRPKGQSPEKWRQEVDKRLEPTTVALRNYGGGKLPIVRQVQARLARAGHQVKAIVQVQRRAPAKLLIGTDLLSQLGFLFVSTGVEKDDVDLLEDSGRPSGVHGQEDSKPAAEGQVSLLSG